MHKLFIILLLSIFSIGNTFAQEWLTNFGSAKEIAEVEHKPIILVFQGSDWCAPCIKLDHEIWSSEAFQDYSKDHYVMLLADFPRKSKNSLSDEQVEANAQLAETYNRNGIFPFVVILDSSGKVLGESGYKKISPQEYIDELNAFSH